MGWELVADLTSAEEHSTHGCVRGPEGIVALAEMIA
jgi:hypothetical protein